MGATILPFQQRISQHNARRAEGGRGQIRRPRVECRFLRQHRAVRSELRTKVKARHFQGNHSAAEWRHATNRHSIRE